MIKKKRSKEAIQENGKFFEQVFAPFSYKSVVYLKIFFLKVKKEGDY